MTARRGLLSPRHRGAMRGLASLSRSCIVPYMNTAANAPAAITVRITVNVPNCPVGRSFEVTVPDLAAAHSAIVGYRDSAEMVTASATDTATGVWLGMAAAGQGVVHSDWKV